MPFDTGVCLDNKIRDGFVEAWKAASGAIDALLDSNLLDGTDKQVCRSNDGRMMDAIVLCRSVDSRPW